MQEVIMAAIKLSNREYDLAALAFDYANFYEYDNHIRKAEWFYDLAQEIKNDKSIS